MAGIARDFGEFADPQSSRLLGFAYALTGTRTMPGIWSKKPWCGRPLAR
jgi:hypothetical protein